MNVMEESLQKHREWKGKIEVCSRAKVNNAKDLTLAYTPVSYTHLTLPTTSRV